MGSFPSSSLKLFFKGLHSKREADPEAFIKFPLLENFPILQALPVVGPLVASGQQPPAKREAAAEAEADPRGVFDALISIFNKRNADPEAFFEDGSWFDGGDGGLFKRDAEPFLPDAWYKADAEIADAFSSIFGKRDAEPFLPDTWVKAGAELGDAFGSMFGKRDADPEAFFGLDIETDRKAAENLM